MWIFPYIGVDISSIKPWVGSISGSTSIEKEFDSNYCCALAVFDRDNGALKLCSKEILEKYILYFN